MIKLRPGPRSLSFEHRKSRPSIRPLPAKRTAYLEDHTQDNDTSLRNRTSIYRHPPQTSQGREESPFSKVVMGSSVCPIARFPRNGQCYGPRGAWNPPSAKVLKFDLRIWHMLCSSNRQETKYLLDMAVWVMRGCGGDAACK